MRPNEVIAEVSKQTGLSAASCRKVVSVLFKVVVERLVAGRHTGFLNFGVFRVYAGEPRPGRNPKTGERVDIPARRRVRFRPSRTLNDAINR